jgi:hypothetical protein
VSSSPSRQKANKKNIIAKYIKAAWLIGMTSPQFCGCKSQCQHTEGFVVFSDASPSIARTWTLNRWRKKKQKKEQKE